MLVARLYPALTRGLLSVGMLACTDAAAVPVSSGQACYPTAGPATPREYRLEFVLAADAVARPADLALRYQPADDTVGARVRMAGPSLESTVTGNDSGTVCFVTGTALAEVHTIDIRAPGRVRVRVVGISQQPLAEVTLDAGSPEARLTWHAQP